ncbi:hypothetical protein LOZ39_004297 [Ophidiomyces ophidiicola]|nr:hypothetical protein LOZ64_004356 [Ophidiomyces ophidiicola]KAI2007470.1 hypothetical protein LOZ50_002570 [Ophidiomyces ophidiicola]KAI2011945.1 hypothetical protein LOZ49_002891 [Ophidiomyces ophidiicola]KAI2019522.1 hypothetical protein LOZ46_003347 [Ophidiomyces ophidiicola]KAI2036074.1 hypothetical protein LOZ45_000080 [Ophidiomyces ophidiicola]
MRHLRDLVAVIALYLNHSTPANNKNDENDDTLALLQPDLDAFSAQLPNIVPAIRQKLAEDIANLRTLASKADNNHQSRIPQQTRNASTVADSRLRPLSLKLASSAVLLSQASLSSQIASRLRNLRTTQMVELLAAQRQMTVTAAEVLSAHTMVMERMVQVLERTKHGSLARAGRARAEYLAAVAEGLDGKVKLIQRDILTTIYTPETIEALQNYRRHLHDTRVHLRERERNALKQLEAYEAADSSAPRAGTMADIARRYAALAKEVENLKMEIKRIGGDE